MKKKAFTLIELLVVISIIAVLMAVMMPALGKAREIAKRTVCMSGIRQLGVSWVLYSEDYNGRIVNGCTKDKTYKGRTEKAWVQYGQDVSEGALYPYVKNKDVYKCSAIKGDDVKRTYSLFDSMNGYEGMEYCRDKSLFIKRIQAIKRPCDKGVFIDENLVRGAPSYDSWSIYFAIQRWGDVPPVQHKNGVGISYADGHTSYFKYKDKLSTEYGKAVEQGNTPDSNYNNSADIPELQKIAWGKLGYKRNN